MPRSYARRNGGFGGRVGFGVFVGAPLFYPGYYPYYPAYYPAPYYYPPAVAMQSAPQVYIEQGAPQAAPVQAAPAQTNYWYFCAGANAYYPYVKDCPGGWQRVAPQPAQ